MTTTTITFSTDTPVPHITQKVYLRRLWSDTWTLYDDLWCTESTWACAPTINTATLVWFYGLLKNDDHALWETVTKLDVSRWYVKVLYEDDDGNSRTWYGIVGDVDDEHQGHVYANRAWHASGQQTLHCYGMEHMLDREPVASSWCYDGDPDVLLEVDTPITFNKHGRGNRSESQHRHPGAIDTCYLFDGTPELPSRTYRPKWDDWSTREIVNYLLRMKAPSASTLTYNPSVIWWLDALNDGVICCNDKPVLEQEGQTVLAMLNQLVDRRRLRTWDVYVEEDSAGATVYFRPLALHKDDITLPDGTVLLGVDWATSPQDRSPELLNIVCDHDPMTTCRVRQVDTLKADHIIVRGARRTSTATFYVAGDRLEAAWTSAQETAYEAGASGEAGYAGWDSLKKATTNAEVRAHADLAPVFCWFRIPDTWDLKAGYTATDRDVFVDQWSDPVDQYVHEVFVEPELALWEGIDYSGTAVSGTLAEPRDYVRREPLLVFKRPDDNRYVLGPEMARPAEGECDPADTGTSNRFNCTLRVQPDSRVVEVHVRGEPQHAIAQTDFSALTADRDVGDYDYKDREMLLTLTLQENRYCEGRWPTRGGSHSTFLDTQRGHVIYCGGDYRQDYLALDTVVDVDDDGTLKVNTAAGYVRDDSETLENMARIIYEWYAVERRAITISTRRVQLSAIELGDYIEQFGDASLGHNVEANSVVTEITLKNPIGDGNQRPQTEQTITTSFGELDVLSLMPDPPRR